MKRKKTKNEIKYGMKLPPEEGTLGFLDMLIHDCRQYLMIATGELRSIEGEGELALYSVLRDRVREALILGQRQIDAFKVQTYWQAGSHINEHVRTYWETGWWIKEHIFLNRHRARYGGEVLGKLSRDEGVSQSVLDRCKQFSEKFLRLFPKPISAGRQKLVLTPDPASKKGIKSLLNWSHYRTLLPLEDDKLRRRPARPRIPESRARESPVSDRAQLQK